MVRFFWSVLVIALGIVGGTMGLKVAEGFLAMERVVALLHPPAGAPHVPTMMLPAGYEGLVQFAFVSAGILLGGLLGSIAFRNLVILGNTLEQMPANDKLAGSTGVLSGLLLTYLVSPLILNLRYVGIPLLTAMGVILSYLGVNLMMGIKGELGMLLRHGNPDPETLKRAKILDTNVIIDGRIADVARAGFLEGQIYVPGFVLDELQHIADSGESIKRARGRRGLDILNAMQKERQLIIRSHDGAFDENDEVDSKLVKLAKALDGCLVTNDFNLNKVAELQGIQVLNVNELANALKPVVLPGEEMNVTIIKEGKELNQGVAYLDDGTMIVVEGARRHINETVSVVVTSVLQTVAGKMIFANIRTEGEEEELIDRDVRSYTGGRPRKKV